MSDGAKIARGKHANHARGPRQHRWNDRRMIASNGYVKLRVGKTHPLADSNGYAYEHHVVWCAAGHAKPANGFILHHRNGEKTDNRIENLELLSRAEHNRDHLSERARCQTSGRLLAHQERA